MRTITNQELKDAVKKAKAERRLARTFNHSCKYEYVLKSGRVLTCAVGAALTSEEMEKIRRLRLLGASCYTIHNRGVVGFEDIDFAEELQNVHDRGTTEEFNRLLA